MESTIIGSKEQFAIEYKQGSYPKLGYIRIWLNNIGIGADEEVYFSYVQGTLRYILTNKDKLVDLSFESKSAEDLVGQVLSHKDIPSIDRHIIKGLGESFDDFLILCFFSAKKVNFVWQLVERPYFDYADYPQKAQIASLDISDFEDVVQKFDIAMSKIV